jgi:CheY-like chemotaxis protein
MSNSEIRGKVLVIDDNEKHRKSIAGLLNSRGFETVEVSNEEGAKDALANQKFDLVTIDMDLGDKDRPFLGEILLDFIRKNYPSVACIMISGSGGITFKKVLYELPDLDAFIHKHELTPKTLEEAIERAKKVAEQRQLNVLVNKAKRDSLVNPESGSPVIDEEERITRPTVFISYSHKDEIEKDELVSHLGILAHEGLIDLWVDDEIEAGGDWYHDIEQTIGRAKVAILLITKNFLNSKFILGEEIPRLLELRRTKGLNVIPIIARPCAWNRVKWLIKMNVKPKNGSPVWREDGRYADEELARIAEIVAGILDRAMGGE